MRARVVLNATGVWTDDVEGLLGGPPSLDVEASKGIHLVVPRDRIRSECGFITRTEKSVLFVIPWGRHWIIGTTDTAWDLDLAHPAASRTDIDYLLEHVNKLLRVPARPSTTSRACTPGCGRCSPASPDAASAPAARARRGRRRTKVSREHTVVSPVPGLVLIAGGKLTTYRVMARDAVDLAVRGWPDVAPSHTERVPLLGADGFLTRTNQRVALSRRSGLEVGRIDHLLGRYGGLVDDLLELVAARPELASPCPAPRTTCPPRSSTP